jgi:hypothetical protein
LHDEGRILVALFGEGVEFRNGVVEGLLGEVAGAVGAVENLVVEDGEVEGETEADGVRRWEFGGGDVRCLLVSLKGLVCRLFALGVGGELGEVTVVVALPARGTRSGLAFHAS